ncbi:MAG: hypothetical protein HFJ87_05960 [Muribaculaceae bacterium]|nr:hypothetical protein [Muribaculaceae bacterium]
MDELNPKAVRRRRLTWLLVAAAIIGAAVWIYVGEAGDAAEKVRRRALNDSLHNRAVALVASADSLMRRGDDIVSDAWFVGVDYIQASQKLDEAARTAELAEPALPDPVGNDRREHLHVRLVAARDVLMRQLSLVEGMPKAENAIRQRVNSIDSILGK